MAWLSDTRNRPAASPSAMVAGDVGVASMRRTRPLRRVAASMPPTANVFTNVNSTRFDAET